MAGGITIGPYLGLDVRQVMATATGDSVAQDEEANHENVLLHLHAVHPKCERCGEALAGVTFLFGYEDGSFMPSATLNLVCQCGQPRLYVPHVDRLTQLAMNLEWREGFKQEVKA